jgi:alpha-amylase
VFLLPDICLYFHVHQPHRLRHYTVFDIGKNQNYFDEQQNKFYLERVSRKCYLPTNKLLLDLLQEQDGKFKFSFSITGILLDQLEEFFPNVLESFQSLTETGLVELFDETYYHSLAYLISKKEFSHQVKLHTKKFKKVFGVKPRVFRNTEAMYSNDIAKTVESLGYKAIVSEGLDNVLQWRSPNFVYKAKDSELRLLMRNYKLSDDIAFRFSSRDWAEWPLTANKYAQWLSATQGHCINLFMDFETFGEHQWQETGIFDFLKALPRETLNHKQLGFATPTEIVQKNNPVGEIDIPYYSSWADVHRDLSAWLENDMQKHAFSEIKNLEKTVSQKKNYNFLDAWRKLQISDHFYYMCTKWFADGDVHKYFNPYNNPYDAYLNFMNVLTDFKSRLVE